MSLMDLAGTQSIAQQGNAQSTDIVLQLQGIVSQLSALVQAFDGRFSFGTVTLDAAATTVVPDTAVAGNSVVVFSPTNASAATLMGSTQALYYTLSAGTSFTLATADSTSAAGTETFAYMICTPS